MIIVTFSKQEDGTKLITGGGESENGALIDIEDLLTPEETYKGWAFDDLEEGKLYQLSDDRSTLTLMEEDNGTE